MNKRIRMKKTKQVQKILLERTPSEFYKWWIGQEVEHLDGWRERMRKIVLGTVKDLTDKGILPKLETEPTMEWTP